MRLKAPATITSRSGRLYWRFELQSLGLQYNDNVLLGQVGRQGDFIISPSLDARFRWPISDKQSLNLTLGAGYWVYAQHPALDRFFISPNSEVSFDVYAGDFLIQLARPVLDHPEYIQRPHRQWQRGILTTPK